MAIDRVQGTNTSSGNDKRVLISDDSKQRIRVSIYSKEIKNSDFNQHYYAPNDAIPDYKAQLEKNLRILPKKTVTLSFSFSFSFREPSWTEAYNNFTMRDTKRYSDILAFIKNNKNLSDKSLAPKIANMVCKLSLDYGIPPEITVSILRVESGGYKFTPDVMVNPDSIYKGVMQVDLENIKIMYADEKNANNKTLSRKERAIAYSHRFFRQDDVRINELKQKYPTPEKLYEAIQKDLLLVLKSELWFLNQN